jgi:3-methyladenine DNA glycosylase/8-oxoguanine DNA glycosylase
MNHRHAHQLLKTSHPRMAELIARSRRYNIAPAISVRPFDALAESIAYQQLTGKAAATILAGFALFIPKENGSIPNNFSRRRMKHFALLVFHAQKLPR